ncbi:GrpB family protein [Nocardioides aquiterrae]
MAPADHYPAARLVPYDPAWERRYEQVAHDLMGALGPGWRIEHVGSTSVPGLVAKPVIDLALAMPPGAHLASFQEVFHRLGWSGPSQAGDHQALARHEDGVRESIAHVFPADRWDEAHVRLFADWLRRDDTTRDRYGELKLELVRRGVWGPAYTEAKTAFVEEVVNRARAARGWPPVSP